jgi:hypothetical protein
VYLTRFRTYKIALPPQTKTYEGRWPQIDKHMPPSPLTGKFLRKADSFTYIKLGSGWSQCKQRQRNVLEAFLLHVLKYLV